MSRTRTYVIQDGHTITIASPDSGTAGNIPFSNLYNIDVLGYGQYPNASGFLSQSAFYVGPCMALLKFWAQGDLSASTFTITGNDTLGNFVTETLAGPVNPNPVESVNQYQRINSISIDTDYQGLTITSSNKWTSQFFFPDTERTVFNINMSFSSLEPNSQLGYQVWATTSDMFPTLPLPFNQLAIPLGGAYPKPNVSLADINQWLLLPTNPAVGETEPKQFNTQIPYTAFWVTSGGDAPCEGIIIDFLQQGVT